MDKSDIKDQILALVEQYAALTLAKGPFTPGQTAIPPSGKVIGGPELRFMVEAALDGWLTTGRFNDAFEKRLADFLGVKHLLTVNSGSSANLLALSALTSPLLGERALRRGDEVLTIAASFPTTINPILHHGMVPVFVDVELPTYNIEVSRIEAALSPKTRAIMLAHTLGNPFNLDAVTKIARERQLWLIEDCCDALGSQYAGRQVGGFGDIGTLSFFPAHHITMGEGGAVFTNSGRLRHILLSMRDWGRDCHCPPGKDNTCGNRFGMQLGQLPFGYDHKYTYSHLGYNLKITDMQAALGLAQLDRLAGFIAARKANFAHLRAGLQNLESHLILPEATANSDPSWFGFPLTLRATTPHTRHELITFLDQHQIGTRLLFAGNILCQPYFQGQPHRVSGELTNTNTILNQTLWIGLYPGLDQPMLDYTCQTIHRFFSRP